MRRSAGEPPSQQEQEVRAEDRALRTRVRTWASTLGEPWEV